MRFLATALLSVLVLAGCATAGRPLASFGTPEKAPRSDLVTVYLGSGVGISTVDGKPAQLPRGPSTVLLPAGTLQLGLNFRYDYPGSTYLATSVDHLLDVKFQKGETWNLGLETSVPIIDKPQSLSFVDDVSKLDPALAATVATYSFKAKKVVAVPSLVRQGYDYLELYVGPVLPFFTPDSQKLVLSRGGALKLYETAGMTLIKQISVTGGDLVAGAAEDNDNVFLLDRDGKTYRVNLTSSAVTPLAFKVGRVVRVVMAAQAAFVQTSDQQIVRLDIATGEVRTALNVTDKLIDWSVAAGSEELAYLTQTALTWNNADGSLFHRWTFAIDPRSLLLKDGRRLALEPRGKALAFSHGGVIRAILRSEPDGRIYDQWGLLGQDSNKIVDEQRVFWTAGGALAAVMGSASGTGFHGYVFRAGGLEPGEIQVAEDLSGAFAVWNFGGGLTFSATGGSVSPDGKKFVLQGMGGPFGAEVFYVAVAANLADPPKKPSAVR